MSLRPWIPHLALLGLMAVQVGVSMAKHRTEAELEEQLANGATVRDRTWALHVLANRGDVDPERFSAQYVREMLASDEPDELREMMFMTDIAKLRVPLIQNEYFDDVANKELNHFTRSWMLHKRKVGGTLVGAGLKLQVKELEWILESLTEAGLQLEENEMRDHMVGRAELIGTRKGFTNDAESDD